MAKSRLGAQTLVFSNKPGIAAHASCVGKKEGEGPLGAQFDLIAKDALFGQDSFERAETMFYKQACTLCMEKAGVDRTAVGALLGGDLENQIMAASLAARELRIPFLGLYGACSTMAESLLLGAALADGGYLQNALCAASSHYATAERQYRFPLEYAAQRPPAAQWTVTGAGAALVTTGKHAARITHGTVGLVVDLGVSDAANMGAAMAPAAAATLKAHFRDTDRTQNDYDRVITGDLGAVGSALLLELCEKNGFELSRDKHMDCGLLIFSPEQDTHAGGSGCGCSASVLSAYILPRVASGEWKRVLFMATGALLSPTANQQGETIPGVAHAVVLEHAEG